MLAALQVGNLPLVLVLGLAVAWRVRDRPIYIGLAVALLVSAKLFLWPVLLWLALTRRLAAVAYALVFLVGLNAIAWLAVGAASVTHYIHLVERVSALQSPYTYYPGRAREGLGLSPRVGDVVVWTVTAALDFLVWKVRDDERLSYGLVVIVALVASPIVWLHYLALLLIPVALTRESLSWPWLTPLALILCPGQGNGNAAQTVVALLVMAVVTGSLFTPPKLTGSRFRAASRSM